MKVLVAIEDKLDALAIVETIHNRNWPSASTELVLVHVIDVGSRFDQEKLLAHNAKDFDEEARSAYRLLMNAASELRSFMPAAVIDVVVCVGQPTAEILSTLEAFRPNVLVIGKHSRNRLMRLFHPDIGRQILHSIPPEVEAVHVVEVPTIKRMKKAI